MDHSRPSTVKPISTVAVHPAHANDGRARNRPIAFLFVTINIIIAMMGTATTPLITAVSQQLNWIYWQEPHRESDDGRGRDDRVEADGFRELCL